MSKLLDLVKGTPSYVLTGKALGGNTELAKSKYTRREAKSGGGYRYFYDDHGKSGKNYSVHKEGSKWRSTYHEGDTDHAVGRNGSHDKHPATGSVIGSEHKSKAAAESAISLHSERQHHASDHGALSNSNAISHIRNQMARMPKSQLGARTAAGNQMLRAIEAGKSQAETLAASGLDAEAAKQVYDGLKAVASKFVAPKAEKKPIPTPSGSTSAKAHVNAKYLDSLAPAKKAKILNHVADHYGVSVAVIEDEVNDEDAENLFEYTATDPAMSMEIYNDFKRQGLMKAMGDNPDLMKSGGPFIGPKGGKWADAKHTIAWKEGKPPSKQRKHAHAGTTKGWHNDHKNTTADEHSALARRHHNLSLEASSARNELSVRPGSNTHFEHGYDSDHHRAMADAHATMARAKDSYGGPQKYEISRVNSYLSDARAHQRNHEDAQVGGARLQPPKDGMGNAATMGKTGSGNPLEFLSDANFRDHTHGWTASDHSDAAREHSARMDHQYALSDDAQAKGDFEEGARRNSAGRYHKEMAEAHEIKSRNPRKLVAPKAKRKDAKLAHSLSAPGGSMADKSSVPAGHHQISESDGPRTVKTSHKSGLYHVHSLGGSHGVTHAPSGLSAGHHKTKAKAVAAAKHMHAVAGDAGSDAKFGKNPSKAALTRIKNAHRTLP